jgi:hypothetical protein
MSETQFKEVWSKKNPCLFLKLDITGAFDSVSWEYRLEVVEKLGLPFGSGDKRLLSKAILLVTAAKCLPWPAIQIGSPATRNEISTTAVLVLTQLGNATKRIGLLVCSLACLRA